MKSSPDQPKRRAERNTRRDGEPHADRSCEVCRIEGHEGERHSADCGRDRGEISAATQDRHRIAESHRETGEDGRRKADDHHSEWKHRSRSADLALATETDRHRRNQSEHGVRNEVDARTYATMIDREWNIGHPQHQRRRNGSEAESGKDRSWVIHLEPMRKCQVCE